MLHSGTSVGPYLIQSRISANGLVEVYLAIDRTSGNAVALKRWPASLIKDQNHREWFIKVFASITKLRHPNICEIYQGEFTEDDYPFVAMEYLRGQSLDMPTLDDELSITEIVSLVIPIADALENIHRMGLLHLSIKPTNLMLTLSRQVKILDFGQGAAFPLSISPDLSLETARYLSPEQVLGKQPDQRSDIFSLGAVFYELITGHTPFVGKTVDEVLASVELADPIPLMEFRDGLSTSLSKISARALARDVKDRYQTAGELARDLRELRRTGSVIMRVDGTAEARQFSVKISGLIEKAGGLGKKAKALKWQAVMDGAERVKNRMSSFLENLKPWIIRVRESIPERKRDAAEIIKSISDRLFNENLFNFIRTYWKRNYFVLFIVSGFLLAMIVSRWLGNSTANIESESMKITRLTANGRVMEAAISIDGNTLVYTVDDGVEQVLMVKDLVSAREKRLTAISNAEEYRGLTMTPDARWIFYLKTKPGDLWGRSYKIPLSGGAEEEINIGRLTGVIAISPDGRKLAYLSESNSDNNRLETTINLVYPEGNEKNIAKLSSPAFFIPGGLAWSPESRMIACVVRDAKSGLYSRIVAIEVDTGSESTIVSGIFSEIGSIAWQTDGLGLVVTAREPSSPSLQLWHVAYPSGKVRRIIRDLSDYRSAGLTRDTKRLVSVQHETMSNIWVSDFVNLRQSQQLTTGNYDGINGLAWTPDNRIVYSSLTEGRETLWVGDPKTNKLESLKLATARGEGGEYHPALSADGKQIVYMGAEPAGFYLWLSDFRSRNFRRLTDENFVFFPTFAADGKSVISSSLQEGRRVVTSYALGGGAPKMLIEDRAWRPVVSPDGTKIACNYLDIDQEKWRIGVFAIGGGAPLASFEAPGDAHRVIHWATDGNAIAYLVTKGGVSNIQIQPLIERGPVQISNFKSGRVFDFAWSHDGQRIAFAQGSVKSDVILIQNFTRAH
jgi:serine/threonine protein kinase/Tol biopolymer transport system component